MYMHVHVLHFLPLKHTVCLINRDRYHGITEGGGGLDKKLIPLFSTQDGLWSRLQQRESTLSHILFTGKKRLLNTCVKRRYHILLSMANSNPAI